MRKIDAIVAKVRYARSIRLERASQEASCAFEVDSLKKKIQMKRHILREFQSRRKVADEEVRGAVATYRDNMHILSPRGRERYADDGVSSDFDLYLAFPRVKPSMFRVASSLPPSSEAGDLPMCAPMSPSYYENRGAGYTPPSSQLRREAAVGYEFPYEQYLENNSPAKVAEDLGVQKSDVLGEPEAVDSSEEKKGRSSADAASVTECSSSP